MKRYTALLHPSGGTQMVENEKGMFVQWEPWMDRAEELVKTPCIKTNDEPKKPTICAECKKYRKVETERKLEHLCAIKIPNYIGGGEKDFLDDCEKKNNGSCFDFNPKTI